MPTQPKLEMTVLPKLGNYSQKISKMNRTYPHSDQIVNLTSYN